MAAGCLFTDRKYVLAGFQEKEGKNIISGFGGKIEDTDDCEIDAAIRETLEELFHLESVSKELVHYLMIHYIPRNQFQNGDYHVYIYNFLDLTDFLHICQGFGIQSPLYNVFPKTIEDLIFGRKILPESEVKHLLVLPVADDLQVCRYFQSDLKILSQL
jgi:hypothetical protein